MVQLAALAIEPRKQAQKVVAAKPQSSSAILSIDLSGSITAVNALAAQVLGYRPEQITGTHFGRFLMLSHLHTETVSDVRVDFTSYVAKGQTANSIYGLLRRADRRGLQPVEVSIAPVHD